MDNMIEASNVVKSGKMRSRDPLNDSYSHSPDPMQMQMQKHIKTMKEDGSRNMDIHGNQLVPDLDGDKFKSDKYYRRKSYKWWFAQIENGGFIYSQSVDNPTAPTRARSCN